LHNEVRVLRRNALIVVASVAVGAVAALTITSEMPHSYTSEADLFVQATASANAGGVYDRALFAQNRVKSYVPLVTNPQVMAQVAASLRLNSAPDELARKITVTSPPDTVLLTIVVKASSASAARDIANETARQFISFATALEGAGGDAGSKAVQLRLTKPATLPGSPSSPRPRLNLALGLFLGLVVGLGVAALRERWRDPELPLGSAAEWVPEDAWPPPPAADVPVTARRRAARVR
jgi:capsular polysaccharide biosynthesis protein